MVRSRRIEEKPKQKKVLYLGKLPRLNGSQRKELVLRISQILVGQYYAVNPDSEVEKLAAHFAGKLKNKERAAGAPVGVTGSTGGMLTEEEDTSIDLNTFRPLEGREGGGAWMCHQIIEQLGIPIFLKEQGVWSSKEIEWMLLNLHGRLLNPTSERATALWAEEQSSSKSLMSEVQKVHGNGLRKAALNWWKIHEPLEDYLYNRIDGLVGFGECRYLYDLTNTFFEGRMLGSTLAQYGRSKERRTDAPLVSLGLLTNEEGFIRRSHYYAGNVSEPGTLEEVYKFLENSPGVITDAGIGTTANVEQMALRGISYLCVVREGFKAYNINFEQGKYFRHKTSNGQEYGLWLQSKKHEFQVEGKNYTDWLIFVKSEAKQAKEDGIIQKQKSRFEKGLQSIKSSLAKIKGRKSISQIHQRIGRLKAKHSRVTKAFSIETQDDGKNITTLTWSYNPSSEQRNGTYIIRSSEPVIDVHQAWKDYCALTKIEAVNRCCKTDLNLRPVYHQKDDSIQAHLFLTLIACTIVQFIRYQLAKEDIHWSWKEIVRVMNTQKVITSEFSNKNKEWILLSSWSNPEQKAKKIYDALQLDYVPYFSFFFKITHADT